MITGLCAFTPFTADASPEVRPTTYVKLLLLI